MLKNLLFTQKKKFKINFGNNFIPEYCEIQTNSIEKN
jgi:hypothetical protein